jgi:hypothetical protein
LVSEVVGTDDEGGGDEERIKGGETVDQDIGRDLRSLGGVSGRAFEVVGVPLLPVVLGTGTGADLADAGGGPDIAERLDRRDGSRVRSCDPASPSHMQWQSIAQCNDVFGSFQVASRSPGQMIESDR